MEVSIHGRTVRRRNFRFDLPILPAYDGAEYDEVIALVWFDSGKAYGEMWFSRSKAFPRKHYRVTMNVSASDEEEISEWISNVTDIEILDWGVDEL